MKSDCSIDSADGEWRDEPSLALQDGEVHIWTATLECESGAVEKAAKFLSEEEKARAARFVHRIDREKYIVCHGIVRSILAKYIRTPPAELTFKRDSHGKPYLDERMNPDGLNFNLSHSGQRMLLGLVLNARIGVDIEEMRPANATMDVAKRFFTDRENSELQGLTGQEQIQGFFNCWTRKEAYLKAVGCGLLVSPRDCEVTLKPGEEPRIRHRLAGDEAPAWTLFHEGSEAGYVGAAAVGYHAAEFRKKARVFES